ncbi:MAG: membrane lipoprotein lipid attachment site-containing protein [Bacteroidota bacterium]
MKKILFVLFTVTMLTACKKEVKIEKNLWKKGGEWNVTSWKSWDDGIETEHIGMDVQSAVFTFNKDKEATVVINGDAGDIYTYKMKYENTESELKLTSVTDQETGQVDYSSIVYYIMWEKDNLDLKSTGGFSDGDTETIILKKK